MGLVIIKCGNPGDDEHLANLDEYMSDDRKLMIGGNGVNYTDEKAVAKQMQSVKEHFGKTKNRSHVQVILPYNESGITAKKTCEYTKEAAAYFDADYQTLYCAHRPDDHCNFYHSHIMINPVNINNGKMMETDPTSLKPFCEHVEKITGAKNRLKFKKNDE